MLMAISRTPYRVVLRRRHGLSAVGSAGMGGAVLSMAINKYCYIGTGFLPPFFGIRHRIIWSHIEAVGSAAENPASACAPAWRCWATTTSQASSCSHQENLPARSGNRFELGFAVGPDERLTAMRARPSMRTHWR